MWNGRMIRTTPVISIRGRTGNAIRPIVWELTRGRRPPRRYIKMQCNNRRCVRPSHMYLAGSPPKVFNQTLDARLRLVKVFVGETGRSPTRRQLRSQYRKANWRVMPTAVEIQEAMDINRRRSNQLTAG